MTLSRTLDVAIVGAGPAGIGTAVALERLDVEYVVLERECIGASFRQWPAEMELLTPSFPANAFGVRDLNAITLDTSPALALDSEHPTGDQYAEYLEAVAEFHELPIETGVDVEAVVPDAGSSESSDGDDATAADGFTLETSEGRLEAASVVWAAGQYQYPSSGPIPGASDAIHVSTIDSWTAHADQWPGEGGSPDESDRTVTESTPSVSSQPEATSLAADGAGVSAPTADDVVIVGGAESGIDAALGLADAGLSVTVVDPDGPWQYRSPDPSEVLSPRTTDRLEAALDAEQPITLVTDARVERIEREETGTDFSSQARVGTRTDPSDGPETPGSTVERAGYAVVTDDGDRIHSRTPPVLSTGFEGGLTLVDDLFEVDEHGFPELTDQDESTATSGLFLVGPQVAHEGQQFCFIYKFRQRFAVVAEAIGDRLEVDTTPLDAYREKRMFIEDLECCEPSYCDC
ncbi:Pyridine nucleotide-disulphide oxidoreductase [Natronorubrum sediminis]|uniref:Pyridine nucleotide-disulphide oxidoreductase n=1 Tax=Natronorubrum sediminis TaxID=640943 RepID=A0A1H6FPJ8_9EURY|nr:NAD(P)/FAD-dependent oxidoreductase [Natronorubrum sediminis]SEH12827.1 Pyridine nucleotide-disulphide oxidoreductase [Natronorubrum sediminis]